ncbi:MAG: chemotaxis protein CheW [Gammaproteobacteria bacterium]
MSEVVKQDVKVLDQTEALGLYLDALFREHPEAEVEEKKVEAELSVKDYEQALTEELKPDPIILSDGQPEWAAKAFQTLFIDIDGMSIALPMEAMSGIRTYPDLLNKLPNSAPWIEGTFNLRGTNIQVVNARSLFLLTNNRALDPEEDLKKPEFIVQIGDGRWGLACHSADRALMIEPDQIRWSGKARRRPWLLGMIKEHLCALLDGDEFIKYLDEGAPPLK